MYCAIEIKVFCAAYGHVIIPIQLHMGWRSINCFVLVLFLYVFLWLRFVIQVRSSTSSQLQKLDGIVKVHSYCHPVCLTLGSIVCHIFLSLPYKISGISPQCSLHTNKFHVSDINSEKKPSYSTVCLILSQKDDEINVVSKVCWPLLRPTSKGTVLPR